LAAIAITTPNPRTIVERHVVDGRDVVGVEGVTQAEGPGGEADGDAESAVVHEDRIGQETPAESVDQEDDAAEAEQAAGVRCGELVLWSHRHRRRHVRSLRCRGQPADTIANEWHVQLVRNSRVEAPSVWMLTIEEAGVPARRHAGTSGLHGRR